ncbi:hypothetical protein WJX73_008695 [Symbiochloris irregularis]|uniref:Translation factor GUF1 homolog, mitochondrial n=1 Tax=Symbiochloris irregularis TaxID=706552 RepID=A0AAW1P869_9CHLO
MWPVAARLRPCALRAVAFLPDHSCARAWFSGRPLARPFFSYTSFGNGRALTQSCRYVRRRHSRAALAVAAPEKNVDKVIFGEQDEVHKVPTNKIRNFSIIAHIDHGKSTLADQLLIRTNTVPDREMQAQYMDGMDLERERGITIKLNQARMKYTASDGQLYCLNLIDTPGHVDFNYEVSRSLAACEGCLLVVDAAQGVEAQTLANVYLALDNELEIILVLNKVDLPGADPERVKKEIEDVIGLDTSNAILASAKKGIGIDEILEAIVKRIPPPPERINERLRALIFDSYYDPYKGVIVYFRVVDGRLRAGDDIRLMNTQKEFEVLEVGALAPKPVVVDELYAGEVGWLSASIRSVADARVGDTITLKRKPADAALPGYTEVRPMVYCGLFPTEGDDFEKLREALGKLQLNDAALHYEPDVSSSLGFGFRCGFLGLLHMDIVRERLEREYALDLIITAPSVVYHCLLENGKEKRVDNPSNMPEQRKGISEPFVRMEMITPRDYVGPLMELSQSRRGEFVDMQYLTELRASLVYNLPMAEVVTDFFDELKSRTQGYASMDFHQIGYRQNDLVRLDIKINGEQIDPLAVIVHKDAAYRTGKALTARLKETIPRQQFKIPIQAAIGSRIVASESLAALRKDVLAKCYGGDVSRKKKLLKKQAEGKKRMKTFGRVEVPQEAFVSVLSMNSAGDS